MTKLEMLSEALYYVEYNDGDDYFQEFIVNVFDDNYFGEGSIILLGSEVDVESIWTDTDKDKGCYDIMIHLSNPEFEGDVRLKSLSKENQKTIVNMMRRHYKENKKKGIEK